MPADQQHLLAALGTLQPQCVLALERTASTNDIALNLAQQGVMSALIVARQQTRGRGQHGRQWQSRPGQLLLSALLPLARPLDGRLALECGLQLLHCPALAHLPDLQLKWANDLYSPQGKWGGILIEPVNPRLVVIGVGINVLPPLPDPQLTQPVTSLQALGCGVERLQLAAQVFAQLTEAVQWFDFDCQHLPQRFRQAAAGLDQPVRLLQHGQLHHGLLHGIQHDGALLLAQPSGLTAYYDGRLLLPGHTDAQETC